MTTTDLVDVLGTVRAEMAGEATSLLLASGIQGEVRVLGVGRHAAVLVHPRDVERALEILAVAGFPARGLPAETVEDEAARAGPADESVTDFLRRGR